MRQVSKILTGVAIGAGMLAASMVSASAEIACQGSVCWHVRDHFDYPHSARIVIHDDNWHWGPRERFVFREHEGRGYWRGRRWIAW
jgi:hypothetical protein